MAQSLIDLPASVLTEILVRLPLRTIFVTRSVCKTFLSLTTPNPHFTALHTSNAAQILAFQFGGASSPSDLLRSAEPELGIFSPQISQLKPLFRLPKIGTTVSLSRTNFSSNTFVLVNSCNGLVYFARSLAGDERSLVCNPVTNEYIVVPQVDPKIRLDSPTKSMWLGFSPVTERYKVLRISGSVEVAAQVFVIGSDSWRDIGHTPPCGHLSWDLCSTLVTGVMYCLDRLCENIISFDFTREMFGEVAFPDEFRKEQFRNGDYTSIGVLGGSLCLSFNDLDAQCVDLWVMRHHKNKISWILGFVVDMVRLTGAPVYGQFKPLQFLRNGEIVMLWMSNNLVCYDPRTQSLRIFGLLRLRLTSKAVVLTPSFVPLKDTLKVEKVLNQHVRPRGDEREP